MADKVHGTPEERAKHRTPQERSTHRATYQGRPVTEVRVATASDPGFDVTKTDNVLIREADGTELVVSQAALSRNI